MNFCRCWTEDNFVRVIYKTRTNSSYEHKDRMERGGEVEQDTGCVCVTHFELIWTGITLFNLIWWNILFVRRWCCCCWMTPNIKSSFHWTHPHRRHIKQKSNEVEINEMTLLTETEIPTVLKVWNDSALCFIRHLSFHLIFLLENGCW